MQKCGCVIVETREIHNLYEIIQDKHMKFIPKTWGLTMFLSEKNKHLVPPEMFDREVDIRILPSDKMTIHDYNTLLTTISFWESIPHDKILVFQTDSEILRTGIEDFIQWDYCGAEWSFPPYVGNGGFSLRSKSIMIEILKQKPYNPFEDGNEDIYFSHRIESVGGRLAPIEIAKVFSVESIFGFGSVAIHGIDKWISKEECKKIRNQYQQVHG